MPLMSDPHVSPALKHLRFGVSIGAGVVALALVAHVLIVALVHFTDIRLTRLEPPAHGDAPVVVVRSGKSGGSDEGAGAQSMTRAERARVQPGDAPADVNLVPSKTASQLRGAAAVVQALGVFGSVGVALLLFQGVIIAGGVSVPGVEKAVTASSWGIVIAFLAIPWRGIMPELVYPGVFQSYATIAHESDVLRGLAGGRVSGAVFFAMHVFLPLCMVAGVAMVAVRFRSGVEHGIIVTHASQLEEQIEREIRERKLGELSTPRAVGALNKAIGLGASAIEAAPHEPAPAPVPLAQAPQQPPPPSPMSARGQDLRRRPF